MLSTPWLAAIVMLLYRHGLRESELCNIRLNNLDLKTAMLWVQRLKNGLSTQHPVTSDEIRLLRRYLATRKDEKSPWLFLSERGGPMDRHTIIYLVKKAAQQAGLFKVTPHMLRHSCGYYLANKGYDSRLIQDYLGGTVAKSYRELQKGYFLVFAALIELYSRYIVGWALSNTMEANFCLEALNQALEQGQPEIINSDQGRQLTGNGWISALKGTVAKNLDLSRV
ncbi:Tyrosine recombinase XerC [Piscirickettsia salmonis]|uniref:Tyrosine recombinase XerC n=1 Tax=Piscirickettsia salmonis TaxID=1238 RepID=A0A9Q6PVK0_PISSA|nr:tyrosine-type recombinase/integrase [Piscirickettsia salmonis]QGN93960.1 Tyrosine recombinase XerC [Piscirickettsia salmonis]QGO04903.1 Tyrosine recombinase XerC [Piscirickettsia salmonis]QGO33224.1 Tyrosine recombinase XerC [Piscirickettsia salmonis]QGO36836.1 Tyrosine recombinase XerC [Piscirickettsia salmonis]QGO40460.1 Tyrosine recombinase XerC [Piscirickettsia salmonis]